MPARCQLHTFPSRVLQMTGEQLQQSSWGFSGLFKVTLTVLREAGEYFSQTLSVHTFPIGLSN